LSAPSESAGLSAQDAKAVADTVIEQTIVPKKIPASDDIDGQIKAVGGALASALLTATEMPLHTLQPVVADLAAQLVAFGIRQTDLVNRDAIHAPAWITDGVSQKSVQLPEPPDPTTAEPFVARTAEAPEIPARIPAKASAVEVSAE
jgi:hypothetical protein